jgi:hypothetical protein
MAGRCCSRPNWQPSSSRPWSDTVGATHRPRRRNPPGAIRIHGEAGGVCRRESRVRDRKDYRPGPCGLLVSVEPVLGRGGAGNDLAEGYSMGRCWARRHLANAEPSVADEEGQTGATRGGGLVRGAACGQKGSEQRRTSARAARPVGVRRVRGVRSWRGTGGGETSGFIGEPEVAEDLLRERGFDDHGDRVRRPPQRELSSASAS